MLLEALVACAGVTLRAVATSLGLAVAGTVHAEGDLDFRGTLGVDSEAPVGFRDIRLTFDLDTDAERRSEVAKLVRLTERYCVVLQTLRVLADHDRQVTGRARVNGAQALLHSLLVAAGSTSASPTPAPRRCTSSPRWTGCRRCGRCSPCSRASPPAPPTATPGWPERPAATLLHLGPGLGNGLANLHNARRAGTPVVNVVGDHATAHAQFDAPLQSDIAAIAGAVSGWVRDCAPRRRGRRRRRGGGRRGPRRARSRRWCCRPTSAGATAPARRRAGPPWRPRRATVDPDALRAAADALASGEPCVLLVGGDATRADGPGRRRPDRRRHRGPAARRDVPRPASSAAQAWPRSTGWATSPTSPPAARAARGTSCWSGRARRCRSSPTPTSDGDLVPAGCRVHPLVGARTAPATAALEELADLLAPGTAPRPAAAGPSRAAHRAR